MSLPKYLFAFLAALLAFAPPAPAEARTSSPRIDSFSVEPANDLSPGADLRFTVEGTPGGRASVRINGLKRSIPLRETESGIYEGAYRVGSRDRLVPDATARASLNVGGKIATVTLDQPLAAGPAATPPVAGAMSGNGSDGERSVRATRICADCGTVDAVTVRDVPGQSTPLGTVAGAVGGAVLGHQVGQGRGNTAATIAGGAVGAVAGNEIERRIRKNRQYDVTVRMDSGEMRTVPYASEPVPQVGERVRIVNGVISSLR